MCVITKYCPQSLADITGQQPARVLSQFAQDPEPSCFLLEGEAPGCGKSLTAHALAYDLGCRPYPEHVFSGLHEVEGAELTADYSRDFFGPSTPLRICCNTERSDGKGWHVVVIEELDWLSPQAQKSLKTKLDRNSLASVFNYRVVVVATSNGAGKLSPALLDRFRQSGGIMQYSGGKCFAAACVKRLREIWELECPSQPIPAGHEDWGWITGEEFMGKPITKTYSMRAAMGCLKQAVEVT